MTDLIFCVAHTKICCYATRIGYLYGVRSDRKKEYGCGRCRVDFVDIDFKKPDRRLHTEVVMRFKPKYAVVLDIEQPEQVDPALLEASYFAGHGMNPIVIPKVDCISDIPKDFILGYSVPTPYGKTEIPAEQFAGRKIHLLGGTPKKAASYYRRFLELGCEIVSIDGNAIHKAAVRGAVWRDRFGKQWVDEYKKPSGDTYYSALKESLQNVWEFWQGIFEDCYRGQMIMAI